MSVIDCAELHDRSLVAVLQVVNNLLNNNKVCLFAQVLMVNKVKETSKANRDAVFISPVKSDTMNHLELLLN